MCCSLRGAAFFGASIHIGLGLLLFVRYVIAATVFTFYKFNDSFKDQVTAFSIPFMFYVTLVLVLAVLIFHSIEKEFFHLLKWSTVVFFLLQVSVFVIMLILKLSPSFRYRSFPFLPVSLSRETRTPSHEDLFAQHHNSQEQFRENLYSTFPSLLQREGRGHLSQLSPQQQQEVASNLAEEADLMLEDQKMQAKNSNASDGRKASWWRWRVGEKERLSDIYRLVVICVYGLLTFIYSGILFLYIRQMNYEDPDHIFGTQAQAVTRNTAFYVQPQFTTIKDYDNKPTAQVQSTPPAQRKPLGGPVGQQPVYERQIPSSLKQSVHVASGGLPAVKGQQEISTDKKSILVPPRLPAISLKKEALTASHSYTPASTLSRAAAHAQSKEQQQHISAQSHFLPPQPPPSHPRPQQQQQQLLPQHPSGYSSLSSRPVFDHRHPNYIKFEQIRQQEREMQQKMLEEEMREEELLTRRNFDWRGRKPSWMGDNNGDGLPLRQSYIQQVNGTPTSTSMSEQTSDESSYCGVPSVGTYKRGESQLMTPGQYRPTTSQQRTSLRNKYLLPNLSYYGYDYPLDSSITRWLLNRNNRSSFLSSYLPKLPSYYHSPYNYSWWPRNRSFSYTGCSDSLSSISISSILIPSNGSSPNLSYIPNQHSCFANLRRKSNNHSMV